MPTITAGRYPSAYRAYSLNFFLAHCPQISYLVNNKKDFAMHSESINGNRSTSSSSTDAAHYFAGNNRQAKQKRQHPTKPPIKPKVLIVHRMPVIRFALSTLISASARFVVCGETDFAPEARELFDRHRPNLIVLGLTLQAGDGIGLIKDFHKSNPAVHCVVLTMRDDPLSMQRAFRAGASGYLVAQDDITEILEMLDQALGGELHASDNVCRALLENLARGVIEPVTSEMRALSDRELQVLSLIGRGFGVTRLAGELHLSVKTIETHQMRIKRKLGLRSAAELSARASRWMMESARLNLRLHRRIAFQNGHSTIRSLI
jgi:DNA-binding NarL/FixJ family response regulator